MVCHCSQPLAIIFICFVFLIFYHYSGQTQHGWHQPSIHHILNEHPLCDRCFYRHWRCKMNKTDHGKNHLRSGFWAENCGEVRTMAWEDILKKTRCKDLAVGVCFACKSKRTGCLECREEQMRLDRHPEPTSWRHYRPKWRLGTWSVQRSHWKVLSSWSK